MFDSNQPAHTKGVVAGFMQPNTDSTLSVTSHFVVSQSMQPSCWLDESGFVSLQNRPEQSFDIGLCRIALEKHVAFCKVLR